MLAYDRAGDGHYDTVSAFIKSLRGNDPDAALYWLAAMVAAGEDPKFIARRLIIAASEDVGNADPRALQSRSRPARRSTGSACRRRSTRSPRRPTYIATAPKSNRSGAPTGRPWPTSRQAARCRSRSTCATPRDRGMKQHGIGVGYRYPHDYEGADVEQQYLPDALVDRRYYLPTDQGYESTIAARMAARPKPGRRRRHGSDAAFEVPGTEVARREPATGS